MCPLLTIPPFPLRVFTLPARSQLNVDLDAEEDFETIALEFEPAKEMRVRITSADLEVPRVVAKMWAVLGRLTSAVGPLGLRRLFVYTDMDIYISKWVSVDLSHQLVRHSYLLTAHGRNP